MRTILVTMTVLAGLLSSCEEKKKSTLTTESSWWEDVEREEGLPVYDPNAVWEDEIPGEIRPDAIKRFDIALMAYHEALAAEKEAYRVGGETGSQRAHLRSYNFHRHLQDYYLALNTAERKSLFVEGRKPEHHIGVILGQGGPSDMSIFGVLTEKSPREEFEEELKLSFFDIDYFGSFDVTSEQRKVIHDWVDEDIEKKMARLEE